MFAGTIIFLVIFAAVALLLLMLTRGEAKEAKQTLSRLDAIGLGPQAPGTEEGPEGSMRRQDSLSSIPWLDRLLRNFDAAWLRLILYQANLKWNPGTLLLGMLLIALIAGYLVILRTGNIVLALPLATVAGAAPFWYVLNKRSQRFELMKERLPEALDLMVAAIRAGHSFTSAMGTAALESLEPVKREFRQSFDEQKFGLDLRVALNNLAYRVPIREVRMIVTAVLIQKEAGGNVSEILDKVAQLIRDDFRLRRQVRVHTAQGRLTGWILSMLPLILGVMLYLVNPEHMSLLWTRPIGLKMLYGSAVMTCIGVLIIRRIIRVEI